MSDKVEIVGRTAKLDARDSLDPEGSAIDYRWRIISAPDTSAATLAFDDATTPSATQLNHSDITTANVTVDDYLMFEGLLYEILTVAAGKITLSEAPFTIGASEVVVRIFRSNYLSYNDESIATIDIDVVGQYLIQLEVFDGLLWSDPVDILVDGREWESVLGEVVDGEYMWNFLSDTYSIVEEREYLTNFFAGITQVAANNWSKALQVETGASLENIQPYFYYRWLHIDNILKETADTGQTYTQAFGEITSDATTLPSDGDTLQLRIYTGSDVYTDVTHTFSLSGSPSIGDVMGDLNNTVLGYSIRANYFTWGATDYLTLNGTVAFEVLGGTAPVFSAGQTNWLYGLTGVKLDKRLYKIEGAGEHTLRNFTLDGHFLVIRGESYKILSVEEDSSDSLPSLRLVLASDLPEMPLLADTAVWAIPGFFTSAEVDWENELVFNADMAYLNLFYTEEGIDQEEETTTRVVGVSGMKLGVFVSSPENSYYTNVLLTKVKRYGYVPLDDSVSRIPRLQEIIDEPEAWLTENNEYLIDWYRGRRCIIYDYFTPRDYTAATSPIVPISIEDDIVDLFWAEHVIVSNAQTVSDNFGARIYFDRETYSNLDDVEYLASVRGLWFVFSRGKTVENLRRGMYIFFALPFAEKDGTIEQITSTGDSPYGRIFVRDDEDPQTLRTYLYRKTLGISVNPTTGVVFQVGDHVDRFTPLVEGIEIEDWVSDPDWYMGRLGTGHFMDAEFYEVQKYHKWVINIDAEAYTYEYLDSAQSFVDRWRPRYLQPIFVIYHKFIDEFTLTEELYWLLSLEFVDVFCHDPPYLLDMEYELDAGPTWTLDTSQFCPSDTIDIQMTWNGSGASGGYPILDTIFFVDPDPDSATGSGDEKGPLWTLDGSGWTGPTFPYTTDWTTIYPWW